MEESNDRDIVTQTDTDSGSDNSRKREREVFKKPNPVKPKREDRERNLRLENSSLKASKKKDAEKLQRDAERIQIDAKRIQIDAERIKRDADTIKELKEKLAEKEKVISGSGGPQEESWRRHVKENETQTLQLEKHYIFSMVNGVLSHPHANRMRKNLGSFHPHHYP